MTVQLGTAMYYSALTATGSDTSYILVREVLSDRYALTIFEYAIFGEPDLDEKIEF